MFEGLVRQVGRALLQRQYKLATAESCTGGILAAAVTAVAGSSQWFDRGFITYSNVAKFEMLGVSKEILASVGAVSEQTAQQMMVGALCHSDAQVAVATTGIAGPSGGTADKPVGMVCFACGIDNGTSITETQYFSGDRHQVRQQAAMFALQQLLLLFK